MKDLLNKVRSASDADAFLHMMALAEHDMAAVGAVLELIADDDPLIRSRGYGVLENVEGAVAAQQAVLLAWLNDLELGNCKFVAKALIYGGVPMNVIMQRCRALVVSARPEDIAASVRHRYYLRYSLRCKIQNQLRMY